MINMTEQIYSVGEKPPLGTIPKQMYAWTLRNERLGEPINAFQKELVDIPELKENELLILNVSCGINYNGVWAALGKPRNVITTQSKYESPHEKFFICGSESSGIVYATGSNVKDFKVGDEVISIGIQYDDQCEEFVKENDPRVSPSFRIWGYEGNWGSFAQFSKVLDVQCVKKPKNISWEVAGACVATGATIHNMFYHWKGNELKKDDIVLVWGGSGGLGTNAITMAKSAGAIPVAVVSSDERGKYCMKNGAVGYINRMNYHHWGELTDEIVQDKSKYNAWLKEAVRFRKELYKIIGKRQDPDIIIEHPGKDTLPTSLFLCGKKGMVVLCGASSGYAGSLDLRYLWMSVKKTARVTCGDERRCFRVFGFIGIR